MLATFFRSNQPIVLLGLLLLVPVLYLPAFFHLPPLAGPAMPLHAALMGLAGKDPLIYGAASLLLVWLICVQVNMLVNTTDLLDKRTHLPALVAPILLAAFGPVVTLDPTHAGLPLVLAALQRAWNMNNTGRAMHLLFDAGVLIGLASLFYLPYIFLVVVLWASISVIRAFQWREYLVALLGTVVVIYFAWGITFLTGGVWKPLLTVASAHPFDPGIHTVQASQRILLWMVLIGFLAVGILSYSGSYRRSIMRQKNLRSAFLAFCAALGILIAFDRLITGVTAPIMIALPLVVFCSHALQQPKKAWVGEAGVLSLLVLALWAQWGW
jgi:hypothetical protein